MPGFGAISELPISALPVVSGATAYTLTANAGSYAISGQAVSLIRGRVVSASAGAYAIAGQAAILVKNKVVTGEAGAYVIGGQNATFVYTPASGAYTLSAAAGSYNISGKDAAFVYTPAGGYTDTHDGYWTKQWLAHHKKPKLAEIVEYVKEQPQEAVAEVRAAVERVYPQIDYREVANNVKLQKFIANQLLKAIKDQQDDEDMISFMMMT